MNESKTKLSTYSDYLIDNGAVILAEVVGGVIGSLGIPILSNVLLTYKQKRFEKNIKVFLNELQTNYKHLEDKLEEYDDKKMDFLKNSLLPITIDYIIDEKQKDKIKYYFNVFCSVILNSINILEIKQELDTESLIIYYYDIIKEMTLFDISTLKSIANKECNKGNEQGKTKILDSEDLFEVTQKYSIEKLKKLNIILRPLTFGEMSAENEYTVNFQDIKLTAIGEKFYKFIFENSL